MGEWLEQVNAELARYEHPLFTWRAEAAGRGVVVTVALRATLTGSANADPVYDEVYHLLFTERELAERGFAWNFQRQLYNGLHDYIVEMFARTPQREW